MHKYIFRVDVYAVSSKVPELVQLVFPPRLHTCQDSTKDPADLLEVSKVPTAVNK